MHLGPATAAERAFDDIGQVERAAERLLGAPAHQGAGDAARLPLVAIDKEDAGELGLFGAVDQIGGAGTLAAHPHVERAVAHERKAALGLVELHRRDAEVKGHAIARASDMAFHLGKLVLDQSKAAGCGQRRGETGGGGIAIEGDDLGARVQKRSAVAAGAEGGVDHPLAGAGRDGRDHLVEQDRRVGGRLAHDAAPRRACRCWARRAARPSRAD